ncbi:hypothetical protein [Latilactobacillus fuchuensis]|uniref:Uncharacterized protein n=2 Tax=Latilactobacillus fuchuensis TaxID=164393 RepID=A0A2N9DW68_9LACO|nr:hypothetical protein [Latilactobacillus fuchuensis]KRL59423.1 hypothetical protein FC69_GL001676 [Latilactobacillus fuchuensis DSM 14340 = JCM 11249]MCP8858356.1 hypothetical protein [Latilactobacillus fuchuensis]SPC38781.1 conserved hypothetical protein [Latilactobacillus fuchuensis]
MSALTTILTYIQDHPDQVTVEPFQYANVIRFGINDQTDLPEVEKLFPEMRLHVNRIDPDYVQSHYDLLDSFYRQTEEKQKDGFEDVWITTSHLSDRQLFLVDLSFE